MVWEVSSKIHVTVASSDPIRQIGLCDILDADPDFEVCPSTVQTLTTASDGTVTLLGAGSAIELLDTMAKLEQRRPDLRVILTGGERGDEAILQALLAGAKGYVDEAAAPEEFKQAIRAVSGGWRWAPRRVLSLFAEYAARRVSQTVPRYTKREIEVLQLLIEGRTNCEIGAALGIETRTVKAHLANLMNKTGVTNRTALSVFAVTQSVLLLPR